jgi:amphiphysin
MNASATKPPCSVRKDTESFPVHHSHLALVCLDLLNFQASLMDEHQWHLREITNGSKTVDKSIRELQDVRKVFSEEIEQQIDRLLIRPLTEYQLMLGKVDSLIKKRKNKLLDYDRHRTALKKMTDGHGGKSDINEEKRIVKQEQQVNQATIEYDRYNNLLKSELPRLLDLRSELLKPGVETLLGFQCTFYRKNAEIFSSATFSSLASSRDGSAEAKYGQRVEPILTEIRSLTMFNGFSALATANGASGSCESPTTSNSTQNSFLAKEESPPPSYSTVKPGVKLDRVEKLQPVVFNATAPNQKKPPVPPPASKSTLLQARALYDFSSEDVDDLPFKTGDVIEIVDCSEEFGWWQGRLSGRIGSFPSNYVKKL